MKRMNRLLSILLVLVFLASLFPTAALAEEPEEPAPAEEPGIEEPAPAEEPGEDPEPIEEPEEEPEPLTPLEGEDPEALPQPGDEPQEIIASGQLTQTISWSVESSSGGTTLYISAANTTYENVDLSEGGAAPWYEYRSQIHTVQVGSGITRIGNYWFYGMGANEFKFADSVYEIGDHAFEGCSGLGKTQNFGELGGILPKNLEKIGSYAFKDCTGLVAAYNFPGTLTSLDVGAFYGCTNLTTAYVPAAVGSVPMSCFENCTKLYAVALPEGLTRIWSSAFKNSGLQSLYTPSTMQYVMANACEGCGDLQYAVFNEGLRSIGGSAFKDCAKLKNVELYGPAGMWGFSIGNDAFKNCPKIESVDFHGKLSEWVHLMLPNIGEGNEDLLNAQLNCEPDGMCGENLTWYFDESDNTLYISGTGEMYTNWGMSNRPWEDHKDAIENVRIGMGCTSIGDFAFYGITIQNLYLPNTLTQIRRYAFNNSLSTGSDLFFEGTKAEYDAIDVDATCVLQLSWPTKHYEAIDRGKCGDYMNWVFDGETLYISGPNSGVMWDFDTAGEQPWYAYRDEVKKVQFSSGFYGYVGDNAFCGFSALETVDLAAGPHTLGDYAFYGCTNLSSIYLQKDYIQRIGRYCFACCTSLTSVTTSPYMLELGDYAFYGCTSLTGFVCNSGDSSLYIRTLPDHFLEGCTALTHVSIPYITGIGENCFAGCTSLPEVSLPRVKTIGNGAFYNCSALSVIGTPALTAIGDEAFARCTALHTVYFPTTLQTLGEAAFSGSGLNGALSLPDGMTEIASFAFSDTAITSVTIPTSVLTVREGAFSACHSLADVYYDGAQAMWDRITIEDSNEPLLEAELHLNPSSGELGENISWSLSSDGVLTISGTGSMDDFASAAERPWHTSADAIHTVRVLPGVTTVAKYSFKDLTNLTTVELADSVTAIYDYAFTNCNSLTELELPPRLWCIGNFCFQNCISLTGIQMPDTVTFLGVYAFGYCRSLQTANVSPNLRDSNLTARAFEGCSKLESIDIPEGIQTIGLYAFNGCSRLTVVYLPSSLLPASGDTYTVDHDAFNGCTALTDVYYNGTLTEWKALNVNETGNEPLAAALLHVLPETGSFGEGLTWAYEDGILTISGSGPMPNYAEPTQQPWFDYEDMILHVRVLDGVTTAGDYAFFGFNRLQTMELADSVTFIGYRSFAFCPQIESLELPANLVTIGLSAFEGCSGFPGQNVVLPETVKNISDKAFMGCGFDSVTLPASLELLGNGVFQSCPNLLFADFAEGCSLTAIPEDSFRDCPNFMLADVPEGITTIGKNAFRNDPNLELARLPASLTLVKQYAFYGCSGLTQVSYGGTLDEWNAITIESYNQPLLNATLIYVPYRGQLCADIWWWINSEGELIVQGTGSMPDFASAYGQPWYEYREQITGIIVSGVDYIGDYAFAELSKVTQVWKSNSITAIGDHAFEKCSSLLNFNCPDSLESIGDKAFYRCTALESVNFNGQLADIGERAFDSCRSLTDLSLPASLLYGGVGKSAFSGCESLQFLQIEGLEEIPSGAFYHCDALESVSLPRSLTSVGVGAFSCCDALLDVWYEGRMVEWNQIDIGANNEPLLNANLHCAPNGGVLANGLIWSWQNGVLTVSGNAPMPDFANNWETPWYGLEPYTTAIVIEEGVKSVGKSAFVTFTEVTELNLPEGLTEIGKYAFDHCSGLESVTLPASLVSVDLAAFGHCTALADVWYRGTPYAWEMELAVAGYNEPLNNATLHYTMEGVPIDAEHFPCDAFCAYVRDEFDPDSNWLLTPDEIGEACTVDVTGDDFTSLQGIEYLTELEELYCYGCNLTELDVSSLEHLYYVDCDANQLTADTLRLPAGLTILICSGNGGLKSLDLSGLPHLSDLSCDETGLTELDLSANPDLRYLYCQKNELTSLDVSGNTKLAILVCADNPLTELNLGESENLGVLDCYQTDLTRLDITGCPILLNAYRNGTFREDDNGAWIWYTPNTSYRLRVDPDTVIVTDHDGIPVDEEHFPDPIFRAYVAENFDLDRNGYLTDFECESVREIDVVDKRISSLLGIEYFYEATVLDAESNELTSLDLSHNVCLVSVSLPYNQLTSLDISGLDQLELLDVELNGLTSLDLSTNTALLSLYCSENALTALDVSACTELQKLYCNDNALTELDVSANTALTELFCDANALTELDLSKNTALQMLGVSQCELSALDVSTLPALQRLACYDNPLSSLKLGSLEALRYLSCYDVPSLNTLDISGCPLVIDAYQNGAQTDYSEYGFVHYEINGHILEIAPGQTVATEFIPDHVPGDINGDGSVNNKDVIRLQKYLKDPTTTVDEAALDVNGDGKVNNKDLIRLTRWLKYHDVEIH